MTIINPIIISLGDAAFAASPFCLRGENALEKKGRSAGKQGEGATDPAAILPEFGKKTDYLPVGN